MKEILVDDEWLKAVEKVLYNVDDVWVTELLNRCNRCNGRGEVREKGDNGVFAVYPCPQCQEVVA